MLGLTEGLECICVILYAILLIRISASHDAYFNTPFFTFFITTGVCGILSVLSFMTHHFTIRTLTYQWAWIIKVAWIINHVGAIGSMLGKLIIIINRYSVLKSSDLMENKWSRTRINCLIAVQFLFPFATSSTVIFYDYRYVCVNGEELVESYTTKEVVSSKAINIVYYVFYVVTSVIFTVLTSRKFMRLSAIVGEGNTKRQILRHQRTMFIIVAFCVASHLVKVAQQALWGITLLMGLPVFEAIWRFYPYANGLATYTAPVILMVFSSKVRYLFLSKSLFRSSAVESTSSERDPQNAYRT